MLCGLLVASRRLKDALSTLFPPGILWEQTELVLPLRVFMDPTASNARASILPHLLRGLRCEAFIETRTHREALVRD